MVCYPQSAPPVPCPSPCLLSSAFSASPCSCRSLGLMATVVTMNWVLGQGVQFCSGTSFSPLDKWVLPWRPGGSAAGGEAPSWGPSFAPRL